MDKISNFFSDSLKFMRTMGPADVLDIAIVAVMIYGLIRFIRRTHSARVANGLLLLVLATWLAGSLNLMVTSFVMRQVFEIGILAVVVLFQPEIRRALEKVGSSQLFSLLGNEWGGQAIDYVIMQTVTACEDMARARTGALIVFERDNRLNEPFSSGTPVDAFVTTELLKNIFYDKSPLHDGAVIIKEGRLAAAGCMLPLSKNVNLSKELGMRHRAGIGMSEQSDAVVIIVSEETGGISVAVDGLLKRHLSSDTFEAILRRELLPLEEGRGMGLLERIRGRKGKTNAQTERGEDKNR